MMANLQDRVNHLLGGISIGSAVVTLPHLAAVYNEDIIDALEHVGLGSCKIWFFDRLLYHSTTAYAGNGLGFCSNFTDAASCLEHSDHAPRDGFLVVLYTPDALTVAYPIVKGAYLLWEPLYRIKLSFDLGSKKLLSLQSPEEIEEYWELLKEAILEVPVVRRYDPPNKIILLGEIAAVPELKEKVKGAMAVLTDRDIPILDHDPVYLAARGAADFAKRAPWTDQWWEIGANRSRNSTFPIKVPALLKQDLGLAGPRGLD